MTAAARPAPVLPTPSGLPAEARAAVLAWYDARGRALPFRASRDPYAILVSEVMAQQTQISRVGRAWAAFLERFPTVEALVDAAPADVLRAWRGMGYDRRALNLRRAARAIVDGHGGRVPSEVAELERLPGIGPYTARAVAAIAFGRPVGAVDTNVRRVIGRATAGAADALPARALQAVADASVPVERPADWTHALMDLGATLCGPRMTDCNACPLRPWCRAARLAADASPAPGRAPATLPRRRPVGGATPFPATSRWLRGRIVDRLRDAPGAAWTALPDRIGEHGADAIERALAGLARDGVIERDPADRRRARLATS